MDLMTASETDPLVRDNGSSVSQPISAAPECATLSEAQSNNLHYDATGTGATLSEGSPSSSHSVPVSLKSLSPEPAGHAVLLSGSEAVPPTR